MIERLADVAAARTQCANTRAPLIAISGIDGSGKSTLAPALAAIVGKRGVHAAVVTLDPWHMPAAIRFNAADPARHFYRFAFRWDELFERLIDPFRHPSGLLIRRSQRVIPAVRRGRSRAKRHRACYGGMRKPHRFRRTKLAMLSGKIPDRRPLTMITMRRRHRRVPASPQVERLVSR